MSQPQGSPVSRAPSVWRTLKAVAWGFVGIRGNSEFQTDAAKLNPLVLIGVGITTAFGFVALLIVLVNQVVKT